MLGREMKEGDIAAISHMIDPQFEGTSVLQRQV